MERKHWVPNEYNNGNGNQKPISQTLYLQNYDRISGHNSSVSQIQNNGGNFVCYLSGHEHHDRIMVPEEYPNQLCINITCASNVYAQYKNGDQSRYGKTFANAFNLVVINPNDRVVVVKRIGADMDVLGRDRSSMGYDYGQHRKLYG